MAPTIPIRPRLCKAGDDNKREWVLAYYISRVFTLLRIHNTNLHWQIFGHGVRFIEVVEQKLISMHLTFERF